MILSTQSDESYKDLQKDMAKELIALAELRGDREWDHESYLNHCPLEARIDPLIRWKETC